MGEKMTYQEDIERYICGALYYPLKDEKHLIEMICLHFPDVNEAMAITIATNFLNRIQRLKRSKRQEGNKMKLRALWFGIATTGLAVDLIYLFYDGYWTDKSKIILMTELIILFVMAIAGIVNAIQIIKSKD